MNRKRKNPKGFTLVEILIVVVILAILAAMLLPRFINQSENGYIADAQNMLGSLRSSYITVVDASLATPVALTNVSLISAAAMATWGMKPLTAAPTVWTYACTAAGTCTATRVGGTENGGTIRLDVNGTWTCTNAAGVGYTAQADPTKGCKPA